MDTPGRLLPFRPVVPLLPVHLHYLLGLEVPCHVPAAGHLTARGGNKAGDKLQQEGGNKAEGGGGEDRGQVTARGVKQGGDKIQSGLSYCVC